MSDRIPLHKEYGLNPSIMTCYYCGKEKGIALLGAKCKTEAPRQACFDKEPCPECKELMEKGTMFIEVRDGEMGQDPYRTGQLWVITKEAAAKLGITGPMAFVEESMAKRVGFYNLTNAIKEQKDGENNNG